MKISFKSRIVSVLAVTALAGTVVVGAPTAANAAPQCLTANFVTQCAGVGADGAPYTFVAAANFNGTVFVYSHGVRPSIDIPATLAPVGPYTKTNAAEPAPLVASDLSVMNKLIAAGYGVAGSGFSRQGINTTEALAANKELIATFKTKFPTTKTVIAWGASLGAMHSQMLAEKHPELVDGVILACPAANPQDALIAYFGDALWGFKALFDPSIKVGGYSTDPATRVTEQYANIGKVLTVLGKLSAGLSSGAWPDTASPAGKALQAAGIPSRSALLTVGLMAGVSTRSKHVDGTSGPTGAAETYPLAVAPAVAILENMGATLNYGTLLIADGELLAGGKVYDNTKTDYAARVAADADIFSFALSGNSAVAAIIGSLAATSLAMIPMTFFPPIGLFVLAGFLLGLGWGPMNPLMNSMVQQRVAPHIQGRVFGVQTSLFYASGPIGMFVTGVSVDAFGVRPVYIAAVSILIIFQLFIMFLPDLHDLDREAQY